MIRTKIFVAALSAAVIFPAAASAHCGTMQGSFAVTCEKGVQVYRHQALSSLPQGLSDAQTRLEVAKIRAKTQRAQVASTGRIAAANANLRRRELAVQDYRARVYDRSTRRRSSYAGYGGGFGFGGFNTAIGSPITRLDGLRSLPNRGFRNRGQRNIDAGNGGNNSRVNGPAASRSASVLSGRASASQPVRALPNKKH